MESMTIKEKIRSKNGEDKDNGKDEQDIIRTRRVRKIGKIKKREKERKVKIRRITR